MVVNFRARGISRGTRKLARTPTLIIIIKKKMVEAFNALNHVYIYCQIKLRTMYVSLRELN
jgi:hypothetical protein